MFSLIKFMQISIIYVNKYIHACVDKFFCASVEVIIFDKHLR